MSGYFWYCCEVDIFHIGITEFFNPKLKTAAVFYETIKFKNKICFRNHQKKNQKTEGIFSMKKKQKFYDIFCNEGKCHQNFNFF